MARDEISSDWRGRSHTFSGRREYSVGLQPLADADKIHANRPCRNSDWHPVPDVHDNNDGYDSAQSKELDDRVRLGHWPKLRVLRRREPAVGPAGENRDNGSDQQLWLHGIRQSMRPVYHSPDGEFERRVDDARKE